jgi:hypothetical protein
VSRNNDSFDSMGDAATNTFLPFSVAAAAAIARSQLVSASAVPCRTIGTSTRLFSFSQR